MSEQHSPNTINRRHVIESSIEFLLKQVGNQRLHVANLLAKTGDADSYEWCQDVFMELEDTIRDIGDAALEEVKEYYSK